MTSLKPTSHHESHASNSKHVPHIQKTITYLKYLFFIVTVTMILYLSYMFALADCFWNIVSERVSVFSDKGKSPATYKSRFTCRVYPHLRFLSEPVGLNTEVRKILKGGNRTWDNE